ncbi:hypothetical protein Mapa_001649 [Marchantia paleacea]|nr:hypothetical protein Mapa_001649 [Marchantia paleacea]
MVYDLYDSERQTSGPFVVNREEHLHLLYGDGRTGAEETRRCSLQSKSVHSFQYPKLSTAVSSSQTRRVTKLSIFSYVQEVKFQAASLIGRDFSRWTLSCGPAQVSTQPTPTSLHSAARASTERTYVLRRWTSLNQ